MAYDKEYYEKNAERLKENQRKYRQAHKDELLERQREWRSGLTREEKDEINKKAREKRASEGDLARERYRMYYYKRKERLKGEEK